MSTESELRAKWGNGYTMTCDDDGQLTGIIDSNGDPVPPEEWEAFQEYQDAAFDARLEAARYYSYYGQRGGSSSSR